MNTCRLCKKMDFEEHRYPLIRYGVRHSAHADCGLKRWGDAFFTRLTPWQLERFPAMAAYENGLLAQLQEAISKRPYRPTYKSAMGAL